MKLKYSRMVLIALLFGAAAVFSSITTASAQDQRIVITPVGYYQQAQAQQCACASCVPQAVQVAQAKPIGYQTVRISQKSKYPIGLLFNRQARESIVWGAGMPRANIQSKYRIPIYQN